jgi:3-hydroxyisobutyrate dehydrogenase-like beta-hydroxyacid dehydrogenase
MRVGFIGLGRMGSGIASNIRKAGHEVTVHDVRAEAADVHIEAGCSWAASPRDVGSVSDVVFTSLPDPGSVQHVALGESGLLAGMSAGTTWFDLSTNAPSVMRRLHGAFSARDISVLDAPVSGGPDGARNGTLTLWIGGSREQFTRFVPVLESFGSRLRYVGDIGTGCVAKLVHNAAGYALNVLVAEVFTAGVKAGIPPLELWEAVSAGGFGQTGIFDILGGQFLRQRFDPPAFPLSLAHKDVRLMTELAKEVMVPMRLVNSALEEMTEAVNRGWSDRDWLVAAMLQVERAGLNAADLRFSDAEIEAVKSRI